MAVVAISGLSSSLSNGGGLSLPLAIVAVVSVAVAGSGISLSSSGRLSLPLAVVAVVSVAVAMSVAVSVATIAVAMAVAVPGLSQDAANKGKRKNSQQLHDVFGSSFS